MTVFIASKVIVFASHRPLFAMGEARQSQSDDSFGQEIVSPRLKAMARKDD